MILFVYEVCLCQQALKRVEILRTESMDSQDGPLLSSSGTVLSCLSVEVGPPCMPQLFGHIEARDISVLQA